MWFQNWALVSLAPTYSSSSIEKRAISDRCIWGVIGVYRFHVVGNDFFLALLYFQETPRRQTCASRKVGEGFAHPSCHRRCKFIHSLSLTFVNISSAASPVSLLQSIEWAKVLTAIKHCCDALGSTYVTS